MKRGSCFTKRLNILNPRKRHEKKNKYSNAYYFLKGLESTFVRELTAADVWRFAAKSLMISHLGKIKNVERLLS